MVVGRDSFAPWDSRLQIACSVRKPILKRRLGAPRQKKGDFGTKLQCPMKSVSPCMGYRLLLLSLNSCKSFAISRIIRETPKMLVIRMNLGSLPGFVGPFGFRQPTKRMRKKKFFNWLVSFRGLFRGEQGRRHAATQRGLPAWVPSCSASEGLSAIRAKSGLERHRTQDIP